MLCAKYQKTVNIFFRLILYRTTCLWTFHERKHVWDTLSSRENHFNINFGQVVSKIPLRATRHNIPCNFGSSESFSSETWWQHWIWIGECWIKIPEQNNQNWASIIKVCHSYRIGDGLCIGGRVAPIGIQKVWTSPKCNLCSFEDNWLQLGVGMGNTSKYLSSKGRDEIFTTDRVPCKNVPAYRNGRSRLYTSTVGRDTVLLTTPPV